MTELHRTAIHAVINNSSPQLSWNPFEDLATLFHFEFMVHAFQAGTIIAIVAGAIGYFVVLRGSAFAAHALSHIGFAGATGAVVIGLSPIAGLLAFTLGAGVAIGALGSRLRGRDVTIGIVLAWTLGLGVLFISLYRGYATEAYAILFGEILGISTSDVAVTLAAGVITLIAVGALYRPLLFSSVDEDLAAAKGVPVTALSIAFMAILAIAVTEAVQVVGVLLIFALVVTPAAIAVRFTSRPAIAIATGIGLALTFSWLGLAIAFYSPHPVSFFITSLAFATYVAVRIAEPLKTRMRRTTANATA
ncbi:MAG: metal ABC transporter permease [Chloroflexi bacterium]|nr:MAG: metal ABC transporter permease [Chloroflexota bacterium]